MRTFRLVLTGTLALAAPLAAQTLTGAGATFPNPIYTKWFDAYSKQTGIQINYQSTAPAAASVSSPKAR